jgi:tellurite resistance protein
MFPWDQPQHVQASYGAFVGGATWMAKLLRNVVVMANNRSEALRMLAQADGSISEEERRLLREMYGYSDEELESYKKKPARRTT